MELLPQVQEYAELVVLTAQDAAEVAGVDVAFMERWFDYQSVMRSPSGVRYITLDDLRFDAKQYGDFPPANAEDLFARWDKEPCREAVAI